MSTRRARGRLNEGGMTLTELIVAIVITGILILPIAMAVNFALQAPAQTTSRSASATSRSISVDVWARDVASASFIYLWKAAIGPSATPPWTHTADPTSADVYSTTSGGVTSLPGAGCNTGPPQVEVAQFAWYDTTRSATTKTRVDWQLNFTQYQQTPQVIKVDLRRTVYGSLRNDGSQIVVSGFCVPGDTVLKDFYEDTGNDGTSVWYGSRRVRAYFSLRDAPTEAPHVVNLEAATRPSCINAHPRTDTAADQAVPLGQC